MAIEANIQPLCHGYPGNRHPKTPLRLVKRGQKDGTEKAMLRCGECAATVDCDLSRLKNEILVLAIEIFPMFAVKVEFPSEGPASAKEDLSRDTEEQGERPET